MEPLWNSDWGSVIGPPLETPESRINVTQLHYPPDPNASIETIDPDSCRNVIHIKDPLSLLDWGGTTKLALVSSGTFAEQQATGNEYVEIFAPTAAKKELRPALLISYSGSSPQVKPVLSYLTGDAFFKDSGAQPNQIFEGHTAEVVFRARYISAAADGGSGSPPSVHQLLIDRSGDGDYNDAGEQIDMTEVDKKDKDFSDGKDYETKLDLVFTGSNIKYQFNFKTADGVEAAGSPTRAQSITAIQASKDSKRSSNNLCFISSITRW